MNKLFLSPLHGENLHREEQVKLKGKKELGANKKEYGNKHSVPLLWPTGPLQIGCVRPRASHKRRGRRRAASFMSDVLTQKRVCEQESAACERANWIEPSAQFSYP